MALSKESQADIDRFFTSIKSLAELDRAEVRNVVNKLVGAPTNRENYFLLNYNRATLNVDLLLTMKDFKDFQVVAIISRFLFETAVEMWMMTREKDSTEKITAFIECEKLRAARRIAKFGVNDAKRAFLLSLYIDYIAQNEARIDAEQARLWPGQKKIGHWPPQLLRTPVPRLLCNRRRCSHKERHAAGAPAAHRLLSRCGPA